VSASRFMGMGEGGRVARVRGLSPSRARPRPPSPFLPPSQHADQPGRLPHVRHGADAGVRLELYLNTDYIKMACVQNMMQWQHYLLT
jgi:hypothetical protein